MVDQLMISDSTRLIARSLTLFGLALLSIGCGAGPQAEFTFRESTEDLVDKAKQTVKETVEKSFGTPNELVMLKKFPVEYGGASGTVSSTDDKGILVKWDGESQRIRNGQAITWITGALADEKTIQSNVASFDSEANRIAVFGDSAKPAEGDRFVVGFGDGLRLGKSVYMKNCLHCHGVSGDGAGPTGKFLNPRPRDFRNGLFKFTSTRSGEKARRDDLDRIVKNGIPGTYMPSFLLLGDRETKAVIEYVKWLAIRGEFEKRLTAGLSSDFSKKSVADSVSRANAAHAGSKGQGDAGEKPPTIDEATKKAELEFATYLKDDLPDEIDENIDFIAGGWNRAEEMESVVLPSIQRVEDTPESRERGRLLYLSDKTKCYDCHGVTGRGDGKANDDFWPKPGTTEKYSVRGLHDEWGNLLQPRNLTLGQYRGGRRPVDLFRRVYVGIKGTPMPAFGGRALNDSEIWDLVNFVMSLPYSPRQSPQADHVTKLVEKPTQ